MKFVIANWKMNPATYKEAERLYASAESASRGKKDVKVIICAPFVYLSDIHHRTSRSSNISLGAQDCFWENSVGPYTGEVSPAMLKNSGVEYVILGHSERRANLNETDEMVAKKVKAALRAGLKVVLCVGEPWEVRKKGPAAAVAFVRRQLRASLKGVPPLKNRLYVVYEPVWAISTSKTHLACDPDEAEVMVRVAAAYASIQLGFEGIYGIYGGSVNGKNAKRYLSREYIDGVLPGAASLKPAEFKIIIDAAQVADN